MTDRPYLMTGMELAWGYLTGQQGVLAPAADDTSTPRAALERVIIEVLQRQPCGVAFSGGRDSSLVLAVATHVARREGLPDPIPITRVFPAVPEAHEFEFQETVIRHLGLHDWHRVEFDDELDVVGPIASRHLLAHGVMWPPAIASDVPLVQAVQGGSVMDGEGGDEVLGSERHRIGSVSAVVRHVRPVRWRRLRSALGSLAPATIRGRRAQRRCWESADFVTWLHAPPLEALVAELVRADQREPLTYARSVREVPLRRTQALLLHNRRMLAGEHDVDFVSPLLHPEFIHALARDGGWLGHVDRTDAMRRLASDLLPDAVLARTSKASFTRCYMSRYTKEFAAGWNGDGVDSDLVKPEELRRIWLSDGPIAPTAALLQSAWLAAQRAERPPVTTN